MSEANKESARRAWAAYGSGDVDGFAACLTKDWLEHDPNGDTSTLADNLEVIRRQRGAFPDASRSSMTWLRATSLPSTWW